MHPPILPQDTWLCPACQQDVACNQDTGNGVEKILATRPYCPLPPAEATRRQEAWEAKASDDGYWHDAARAGPSAAAKEEAEQGRLAGPEYLVKWANKAYWHCSWVPEAFLARHAKVKLKNFKKARAQSEVVALAASGGGAAAGEGEDDEEAVIEPAWLQVDRVLDRRRERSLDGLGKAVEVLVKWAGREYEVRGMCVYVRTGGAEIGDGWID